MRLFLLQSFSEQQLHRELCTINSVSTCTNRRLSETESYNLFLLHRFLWVLFNLVKLLYSIEMKLSSIKKCAVCRNGKAASYDNAENTYRFIDLYTKNLPDSKSLSDRFNPFKFMWLTTLNSRSRLRLHQQACPADKADNYGHHKSHIPEDHPQ